MPYPGSVFHIACLSSVPETGVHFFAGVPTSSGCNSKFILLYGVCIISCIIGSSCFLGFFSYACILHKGKYLYFLVLSDFITLADISLKEAANPAKDWLWEGIMILVALPFAAASNVSKRIKHKTFSLTSISLMKMNPSSDRQK
jgi:hypothetical protein